MRRFLYRFIFYYIIPWTVSFFIQEISLRSVPNDYSYKNQWLTEHANEVEILSFGSSHGYFGIKPSDFSKRAFNAAHVSQSLNFDVFIFDKFIDSMNELECLILPIDYSSLRSHGMENGQESWRVKNYTIYYDCPFFKNEPQFALECYPIHIANTIEALFNNPNYIYCDSLGFGTLYKFSKRDSLWMDSGNTAMKRHTSSFSYEYYLKNTQYVKHIIDVCYEKGIRVILLTTPTYHTYYDVLNSEQLTEMTRFCNEMAAEHDNTIYLNWLKNNEFDEHDFYDADHLNEFGAEKLTKMLDSIICQL